MKKKHELERLLKTKNQVEIGADIDKHLEAIIKKYEDFIEGERAEKDFYIKQSQEDFLKKLTREAVYRAFRGHENKQLKLIKKYEEGITKKQGETNKIIDEKRKLLILAIKKIR